MIKKELKNNHASLVSILMPCYNHEEYVISSLESVASSDYKLIEFIFIDDASKDNSFNLASQWFEKNQNRFVRTICVRHQNNQGICATFNELYKLSSGDYVSYLASDDLLLTNAISKQVDFALNHDVDFVFSDCQLIDESGMLISDSALKYFGKHSQRLKNPSCLAAEIIFFWNPPWNKFFLKSNLFKTIGPFDESLSYEDRDFITRVLIHGSFEIMYDVTSAYRIRLRNRLTPGLTHQEVKSDFQKADCKNYLDASGLAKILLGIMVYSYESKYREMGVRNIRFIWFVTIIARLFKRFVSKIHQILLQSG